MIDNLHMFLRVSDVLVNLLIVELKGQDAIEKLRKFTTFNRDKYRHLVKYEEFVTGLGIPGYNLIHSSWKYKASPDKMFESLQEY